MENHKNKFFNCLLELLENKQLSFQFKNGDTILCNTYINMKYENDNNNLTWIPPNKKGYIIPYGKTKQYLISNNRYYKVYYSNHNGLFIKHSYDDYVLII